MASRESLYRQAWITASKADKPLTINASSPGDAVKIRFKFYSVARKCKSNPTTDPEFTAAREACEIVVEGSAVIIRKTVFKEFDTELMQQLGIQEAELRPKEEKDADASLERLKGLLGLPEEAEAEPVRDPVTGRMKTPYY